MFPDESDVRGRIREGGRPVVARRARSPRLLDGDTANSLKSILKMLKALAVLKYSGRKKEVQPWSAEKRRRVISRVFSR